MFVFDSEQKKARKHWFRSIDYNGNNILTYSEVKDHIHQVITPDIPEFETVHMSVIKMAFDNARVSSMSKNEFDDSE
jgi:hypothetical protein